MKKATGKKPRGPSRASLREMPEVNFDKAKARRNPYALGIAEEGITIHVGRGGALRDVEPEFEQLAVNAWRAPERIRERHGAHEIRKLRADRRSTRSPAAGLPGPEDAEALPVPANHALGANELERLSPSGPMAREPHPEETIEAPELRSLRSTAEQGKLLPERQVLEREVGAGSERRAQGA
jgi:hypothetical protein